MAEEDITDTVEAHSDRVLQLRQELDVDLGQLCGCPQVHRRRSRRRLPTAGDGDEVTIGVAAHQPNTLAELEKAVEHLRRLRAGGDVAGHHDQVGGPHVGLSQDGIETGQDPVGVAHHCDPVDPVHYAGSSSWGADAAAAPARAAVRPTRRATTRAT